MNAVPENDASNYLRNKLRNFEVLDSVINRRSNQEEATGDNERAQYERGRKENQQSSSFNSENYQKLISGELNEATAEQMGHELGKNIHSMLRRGSVIGKIFALFVAMASDMVDPVTTFIAVIGSPTMIATVLSLVVSSFMAILTAATWFILREELGIFGYAFKKQLLKRFVIVTTIEIIPGIELLPLNTILMMYVIKKIKNRRMRLRDAQGLLKHAKGNIKSVSKAMDIINDNS